MFARIQALHRDHRLVQLEEPRVRPGGRPLGAEWSSRLAGMEISSSQGLNGATQTVLVGRLADQAALAGLLNGLYELHLPVISVECLDSG